MTSLALTVHIWRLKLRIWRLLTTRAAWRLVRRAADWLVSAG